jgi:hypothetical protein
MTRILNSLHKWATRHQVKVQFKPPFKPPFKPQLRRQLQLQLQRLSPSHQPHWTFAEVAICPLTTTLSSTARSMQFPIMLTRPMA